MSHFSIFCCCGWVPLQNSHRTLSSSHSFTAQQSVLWCRAWPLCGRCRAGGGDEQGAPGGWRPGAQLGPKWEPVHGYPPLPPEKEQLHLGIQDQVSARFEGTSCSCCCTFHRCSPLMARGPYHTLHQDECLACTQ